MNIYIEKLSTWSLFQVVFAILLQINHKKINKKINISYIDGTPVAVSLIRQFGKLFRWSISQLSFELINIREKDSGRLINLSISWEYLWKIKKNLRQHYPKTFQNSYKNPVLGMFIEKSILCPSILSPGSLSRSIFIFHVIAEDMFRCKVDNCLLLMFDHVWKQSLLNYAKNMGIHVHYLKHYYPIIRPFSIHQDSKYFVQLLMIHIREFGLTFAPQVFSWLKNSRYYFLYKLPIYVPSKAVKNISARIAVYGQGALHFQDDGLFSDIFFSFQSPLKKEKLVLLRVPNTEKIIKKLNRERIPYCCMKPSWRHYEGFNYYIGPRQLPNPENEIFEEINKLSTLEKRWLKYQQVNYQYRECYWTEFAKQQNIRVFHTWRNNDAEHIAITEAMRKTGGVMSIWQRSYEEHPHVVSTMSTDIAFAFSRQWINKTQKAQGSKISYHVSTGFVGVKYKLLRPKALEIRQQLHAKGVQKIVACFDENSMDDSRWEAGHKFQQKNYRLLLEKVLEHSWLGVIFKPKRPSTLKKRLGDVAALLKEAEQTGRCLVLEKLGLYGNNIPPTLAGLAADVAIQGNMYAGTVALECALAGIPTLSVDQECCRQSRLYELGEGKVVFQSYENLWETLQEHWNSPGGLPGLGDWSPLLDEMDPFRDGRGAERVGTYLHWLIQGFDQGKYREQILEEAADKYCKQWGADKIGSVN